MKPIMKKLSKLFLRLFLAFAALAALALIWAFLIEPSLLTVTKIEFSDARLPEALDGARVVFFADLHVGSCYSEADAERVAKKIESLDPDMLLFGGDLTQYEKPGSEPDAARVAAVFAAIAPPLGKYAVLGNHDSDSPAVEALAREILAESGFTVLENNSIKVAEGVYLAGTKPWPNHLSVIGQDPDDETGAAWPARNGFFTILLAHEPAQIDGFSEIPFALQLSGHTHYGQVALPFFGPLAKTYATNGYYGGLYKANETTMYVTRGVGSVDMRVRFCAPPEIVVITLRKPA
jgi:predicted MPP superfamily phosphohydrolase